jgi:hypothetical protein
MTTSIPAFGSPLEIRFRGIYDYDNLLPTIRDYFESYDFEIQESSFKYKQGGGPAGTEADIKVQGIRFVSHYIKITLSLKGHMWNVNRKEQDVAGKKKVLTGGKIQLYIECNAELDYKNMFVPKGNKDKLLINWMKSVLDDKYTGLQTIDNYITGIVFIRQLARGLHTNLKEYLGMECF